MKINLGTKGFVRFVDVMGNDLTVVNAARVSFNLINTIYIKQIQVAIASCISKHKLIPIYFHISKTLS